MSEKLVIVGIAALAGILLIGGKGDSGSGGGFGGAGGDDSGSKLDDVADIIFNLHSYFPGSSGGDEAAPKKIPKEIDFSGYLSTHEASQLPGFPDTMGSLNSYFDTIRGQPKKEDVSGKWSLSEHFSTHNIFGKEIDFTKSTSLFKPKAERTGFGKWFGKTAIVRYGEHQAVNRQVAEYSPKKSSGSSHGLGGYFRKGIGASDGSLGIPARIKLRNV